MLTEETREEQYQAPLNREDETGSQTMSSLSGKQAGNRSKWWSSEVDEKERLAGNGRLPPPR